MSTLVRPFSMSTPTCLSCISSPVLQLSMRQLLYIPSACQLPHVTLVRQVPCSSSLCQLLYVPSACQLQHVTPVCQARAPALYVNSYASLPHVYSNMSLLYINSTPHTDQLFKLTVFFTQVPSDLHCVSIVTDFTCRVLPTRIFHGSFRMMCWARSQRWVRGSQGWSSCWTMSA